MEAVRPYRLAHQTLCITGFNFETESLVGYVELLIHPLVSDLRQVNINSKQCRIYRVAVNDSWEASFTYNDPTLEICQGDSKHRNLDYFERCHTKTLASVDSDAGNGELIITLPHHILPSVQEMKSFRVCIEFSVENPEAGIKFVVPDADGTMLDRGAHLFTYGHENSARLWFPCLDCYSEVCTWKLEFTVNMYMTAVSVGDLIETVYTADLRKKTYHYYMSTPTAAPNIALAVGPFEVLVDPHMHEVTHFCLPHLMPILKHTTAFLHEVFEFYEELLSSRYPYTCYKQVFVDMAYNDISPYATMSLCSTNLLHGKKIIDQTPITRRTLAVGVAHQFFGCFISMNSWCDAWLPKGLAAYLCEMYRIKAFGMNEYRYRVAEDMRRICDYEHSVGPVVLDPTFISDSGLYFSTKYPHSVSPTYSQIYGLKSELIVRMMDINLGRELMLQVLNKLLTLAFSASQQKFTSNTWSNLLISTGSFLRCISTVTGKDVHTFIEQWVHRPGFAHINGSFVFNRKRNVVELELKQDSYWKGSQKYAGPLTVSIQELDGTFHHKLMIEESKTKFEFNCHSKSRRHKKKKIPLSTLEEVDMDLIDTDCESPVLWIRVDPDLSILRLIVFEQADFMWQYMLRYERCVVSQYEALCALERYPTLKTRQALTATIENDKCFYLIRIAAAQRLAQVANTMVSSWAGPPAMMNLFQKMFSSHSCPTIIRQNNFTNFQHYYIQKAIPVAMAQLRNVHNICPPEVHKFLLDLFKYNDNSRNKFSDNYYRATLIEALAATVTPAVTTVSVTGSVPSTDALTADTKDILEELIRYLNLEKLLPSYRFTVTVSCLKAIRRLQRFGHLPSDATVFRSYAVEGNFSDVRVAALEALVDFTAAEATANTISSEETLFWLLDMVERDTDPYVRCQLVHMLCINPPFRHGDLLCPLSTERLVDRLWTFMNSTFAHDSRLRCGVADLYFTLYGRNRPPCLPLPDSVMLLNLREKRVMNPSVVTDHSHSQDVTFDVEDSKSSILSQYLYGNIDYMSQSSSTAAAAAAARRDDKPLRVVCNTEYDISSLLTQNVSTSSQRSVFSEDVHKYLSGSSSAPVIGGEPMRVAYEVTVSNDNDEMQLSEDSSDSSFTTEQFRQHGNTAASDDADEFGLPTVSVSHPSSPAIDPLNPLYQLESSGPRLSMRRHSSSSSSSSVNDFTVV